VAERSADEREAARRERERRRAARAEEPVPATSEEPEGTDRDEVLDEHGDDGGENSERGDFDHEFELDDEQHQEEEEDQDEEEEEDHEVASGTRRITRIAHLRRAPRGARAERGDRPLRQRAGAKRKHSRAGRIASLLALLAGVALIWFLVELFQPFHGAGHGSVTVTVPPHSGSSEVGGLLERDGVISSSFFFELRATLAGERGSLRSGTYHLQQDMSYGDVLKILTTPPPPIPTTELTIVDGHTRRQIDALLRSQGVRGSYLAATRHSPLLNPHAYGAPRATPSLEGFLFPDTYQLVKPVNINQLVADQLGTFKLKWRGVDLRYAGSQHLSPYDVLIIASMIEGEAQTRHDLALVSSVIYNRLRSETPLGMDSTIRYATGNYSGPLTASQLNISSPYNTRLNKGLPPTPISNPGLAQIQAAAHPARTDYMFFVTKACGNGSLAFASTYQQFLTLDQQYNAARARLGGRSPSRC
jgi:UPF0755 protein